jgi:hypothetical protein
MPVNRTAAVVAVNRTVSQSGKIDRGRLTVTKVAKTPAGARVTIRTQHQKKNDTVTFALYSNINGYWAPVAELGKRRVPGFSGTITFDIDYKAITAKMQAAGVNVVMKRGAQFEINGAWASGHNWGRASQGKKGGEFRAP